MIDLDSMVQAERVVGLKRYFDDSEHSWNVILNGFL